MKNRVILLVEDNPDDVKLTKRALAKNNITNKVVIANDGVEALDYLKYAARDSAGQVQLPAVILLDLNLPKIDGLEVLRQIRSTDRIRRLPVVVLTSSREDQDLIKSYDLGANSFIRKPVDFNQFTEAARYLGLYWLLLNEPAPN